MLPLPLCRLMIQLLSQPSGIPLSAMIEFARLYKSGRVTSAEAINLSAATPEGPGGFLFLNFAHCFLCHLGSYKDRGTRNRFSSRSILHRPRCFLGIISHRPFHNALSSSAYMDMKTLSTSNNLLSSAFFFAINTAHSARCLASALFSPPLHR